VDEYQFGRPELVCEDNIKVGLLGVGCEYVATEVFLNAFQWKTGVTCFTTTGKVIFQGNILKLT
jgi:hypothetical protein